MKTVRIAALAIVVSVISFISCKRETQETLKNGETSRGTVAAKQPLPPAICNPNAYVITLESRLLIGGNWEWVWSVRNPNPGNGTNGTSQDLSHWGMQFGPCFDWNDVVGAAYSFDNITWTSFTPHYVVDPSQGCVTTPVLKYDAGTTGAAKTYYRLVLGRNYAPGASPGYYKSGVRMPCCTFTFTGVTCPQQTPLCVLSQGYWFARPFTVWCQNVMFGPNSYTQAQGVNIWQNAPNNSAVKHAFTQASALQLSMKCLYNTNIIPAGILADYTTVYNFLSTLTYNDILTGSYPPADYPALQSAAGAIGVWINQNECPPAND